MGCGCKIGRRPRRNPAGYTETYYVDRLRARHALAWVDDGGRGYRLVLAAMSGLVEFEYGPLVDGAPRQRSDYYAEGLLRGGEVLFASSVLRKVGTSGRAVFQQMWRDLLVHMAGRRARKNPAPDNHGDEVDAGTQAEIDEAFRTLPVITYGRKRSRR